MTYTTGAYNKWDDEEQWIRITDGCPNQCEYCYAPSKLEYYGVPDITPFKRLKIMDMNLLAVDKERIILTYLSENKNHKEMICGFDYRFLSLADAEMLYKGMFGRFNRKGKWKRGVRIAWDYEYSKKNDIGRAIDYLCLAGFKRKQIEIFMICDWKISAEEVCKKILTVHEWGCLINDCWFDNTKSPKFQLNYWTLEQCKAIRAICRKSNQLNIFNGYDPERKLK